MNKQKTKLVGGWRIRWVIVDNFLRLLQGDLNRLLKNALKRFLKNALKRFFSYKGLSIAKFEMQTVTVAKVITIKIFLNLV